MSYTVKFGADTNNFKKGVSEMVQALEKMNKELVNNQYRQKDCNKAISDAQKELKKTDEEIKKLEKEEKEKGKLDEKQKKDLDDLKAKHKQLGDTIESEKVKLAQLRTEQAGIKGTISDLSKEIAGNNKEWTTLKATMANLASDGVELLGRKLLSLGKSVISVGKQFSSSMSEVGAISGASAEELELLEQTARDYGASTRFSASESAQALKYMALAGWDTQQSIASLGSVLDLAAAGNMDLARASDIVTDYITAFGLSAEDSAHFADVMAYAMANSNTNVEQLGEAYKNCAASAASMGYSVEDVTAVLMTMANAGVKGGEAGTTLNTIMTRLATDTKGCASALEEMGIQIFDENDNLKNLSDILQLVMSAFDGMSDKEQAALSKVIAGQNQYTGFQTILKGLSEKTKQAGQSFGDYSKALEECDGTSEDMAKTMSDNLSGDIKTMQSAFEELALKVYEDGETPLRDLVQFVTKNVVPAIDVLIDHVDKIVPVFVGAASAVGAYKAALAVQSIIKGITSATTALTAAKTAETAATEGAAVAQGTLNTVQAANPIGLVVALIASLVAGLTSYAAIAGTAADKTDELNKSQKNYLQTLEDAQAAARKKETQTNADIKTLESLESTYDDLRKKVNLTTGEEKQLEAVSKDLASTLGISAEELKDKDGKYKSLSGSVDEYIEKLREEIRLENSKEQLTAAYKSYDQAAEGYSNAKKELDDFLKKYGDIEGLRKNAINPSMFDPLFEDYDRLKNAVGDYQFQVVQAAGAIGKFEKEIGLSTDALDREDELINDVINGTGKLGEETTSSGAAVDDLADSALKGKTSISEFYTEFQKGSDALDEAEYALTAANKALEDNKGEIKSLRDEAESARKTMEKENFGSENYKKAEKIYEDAKLKIAQLKTEQVGLNAAVKTAKENYDKAAWAVKSLSDKLTEYTKKSSSLRSELSSLADTYKSLNDGQTLSLDTLMQLAEKYPEYAAQLLNTAGNADKQKEAVKNLYEAKKLLLIQTLETAKGEIIASNQELEATKKVLEGKKALLEVTIALSGAMGNNQAAIQTAGELAALNLSLASVNANIGNGINQLNSYSTAVERLRNTGILDYKPAANSGSGGSGGGTSGNSGGSAEKVMFETSGGGEVGTGSSRIESMLNWSERMVTMGKLTDRQLEAYYKKWLSEEKLTVDESYNLRSKLKALTDKLTDEEAKKREAAEKDSLDAYIKLIDNKKSFDQLSLKSEIASYDYALKHFKATEEQKLDITKRRYNAEKQLRQQNLNYAKAAYEKLITDRTKTLEESSRQTQTHAEKQIKAIDNEMAARQQKQDDLERQKRLKAVEAELEFGQLDKLSRRELEREKQDILNEQAEADYQRKMEQKKVDIQEKANAEIDKNTLAIERLNRNLDIVSNYLAKVSGTQTVQQIVNNNSRSANINLIKNSGTDQQFLNRMIKKIFNE